MPKKLIESKADVLRDLTEQDGRYIAASMERHCRASTFYVSKLLVRTALTNFGETECDENGNDLTRLENRDVTHRSRNCNVLDTDKLGLQVWFAIFEKHGYDFLEVVVKLVESLTLGMGAGEARD